MQSDLFEQMKFDVRSPLLPPKGTSLTLLIGCGHRKRRNVASAADLYTSPRFKNARQLAENLSAEYSIISAKHGLVSSRARLSPYDVKIGDLTARQKKNWAERIARQLTKIQGRICLLSDPEYSEPIIQSFKNRENSRRLVAPLSAMKERQSQAWYEQALSFSHRVHDLRLLYDLFAEYRRSKRTFRLKDLGQQPLPSRGVYVFFDRTERNFFGRYGRIVRVGTHAVSLGSKSLVKTRLRGHLGTVAGYGNHRGSIFRLLVGRALLNLNSKPDYLVTWGVGQHASAQIRQTEKDHERSVSQYVRELEVSVLEIDDKPCKSSMRAIVERQLIALCTEDLMPIDKPSRKWLGHHTGIELIARSGIWNQQSVGSAYDPSGPGSVTDILKNWA